MSPFSTSPCSLCFFPVFDDKDGDALPRSRHPWSWWDFASPLNSNRKRRYIHMISCFFLKKKLSLNDVWMPFTKLIRVRFHTPLLLIYLTKSSGDREKANFSRKFTTRGLFSRHRRWRWRRRWRRSRIRRWWRPRGQAPPMSAVPEGILVQPPTGAAHKGTHR